MKLLFFLLISSIFSKEIIINSQVINDQNLPLEKANISCGDSYTTSNNEGDFTIKCNEFEKLEISYIGYQNISIKINDITNKIILYNKDITFEKVKIIGGINSSVNDSRIKILSQKKFKNNGKYHLQDVIESTPELNYAGGTSRPRYFQIRGMGELSQFSGEGLPHFYVGLFLDDINFTGIGGISVLDDIKQIEIFKGPQSTSFGTNAMAGVINLITINPQDEKLFKFNYSLSSFNGNKINTSINFPLNDKLKSNLNIVRNQSDGYIKNQFRPDQNSNKQNEQLLKLKLLFTPNINSSHLLTYYNIKFDNLYDAWTIDNNGYNTMTDFVGEDKQQTNATSLKSIYNFNTFKLTSITTVSDNELDYNYDGDWGNNAMWESEPFNWDPATYYYNWDFPDITNRIRKNNTQELRFSLNNIVFGLFYSELEEKDDRSGYFFNGDYDYMTSEFNINNSAIYAKYFHDLTKNLTIDLSFRFDKYKTTNDLYYLASYYGNFGEDFLTIDDENLGWDFLLTNNLTKTNFLTFSISKGFKTAGINQSPNFSDERYYKTEDCLNTEIGYFYKNNKISFESSIFYMKRNNPQLRLFIQRDISKPTYFDYATFNGSKSYNYGVDANLNISNEFNETFISLSLLKSKLGLFYFDETGDGNDTQFGNRAGAHSPEISFSIGNSFLLSESLNFNIDANYLSSFFFDEQNSHKSSNRTLFNTNLIYQSNSRSISFWIKNLLDQSYETRGFSFVLEPETTDGYTEDKKNYKSYGPRRTIGITFEFILK